MTEQPRRRWVLSPGQVPFPGPDGTIRLRTTTPDDDESLASLRGILATPTVALEPEAPTLDVLGHARQSSVVRVRITDVEILAVTPDSDQERSVLMQATPIGGYRLWSEHA